MRPLPLFTFAPILKSTTWGGERIARFKGIQNAPSHVGESWELSSVEGSLSQVEGGEFASLSLPDLLERFGSRLVGSHVYARHGNTFPLLIKYIDAAQDLSIQVHPDDLTAQRLLGKPNGKTESWYILDCKPGTSIVYGFNRPVTPQSLRAHCEDGTIMDVLQHQSISEGDSIFIPAGRTHAICAGTFLIEVQQTSDATFRFYDYNRPDRNGQLRPLHIAEAIESIDYPAATLSGKSEHAEKREGQTPLLSCPYFSYSRYLVTRQHTLAFADDSFHVIINYAAPLRLQLPNQEPTTIATGQTVLVPAEHTTLLAEPATEAPCEFIETHID